MTPPADGFYDLEQHACPRCGAAIGADLVVCPRCAESPVVASEGDAPRPGAEAEDPGEDAAAPAPPRDVEPESLGPVARSGGADPWLPGAIAAASLVVLLAGVLAGVRGLFPGIDEEIAWSLRLELALRVPLSVALWTACGLGALATVAASTDRPLGEWRIAALRLGAAIACARLALFVQLGPPPIASVVEILLQGAIFVGLVAALFRAKIGVAGIVLVVTLVYGVAAALAGWLLGWALLG